MLFNFSIPSAVGAKLYPFIVYNNSVIDYRQIGLVKKTTGEILNANLAIYKSSNTQINVFARTGALNALELDTEYLIRYEATFLLSDSLI